MATVREILKQADELGVERLDAEVLLAHALERDRSWVFAHVGDALDAAALSRFQLLLQRRAAGEPVAYLTGRRGFWSLQLEVTPATLIPRPETELLVTEALQRLANDRGVGVADLGTGSGAVALAIARERPGARVVATDASSEALAVARRNAARLALYNVEFALGDWCAALGAARFELIVSNPPYIEAEDPHLGRGDLRHEPRDALVSGRDGLDAIRRIIAGAGDHLAADGWLLLEHGWRQGAVVRDLLHSQGYREIRTACDLERRERVSGGRWPRPQP
ncbi:MAG TPA: peptide chain release factor N(5)-glutamine methyltransferase [Rhodanobacteraceae bacterium]|nr:peptide chain release factor N(5)-glutamine methyltransferase [Rhodanobacteraceae bacterium]